MKAIIATLVAVLSAAAVIPAAWADNETDLSRLENMALGTIGDLAFAYGCGVFTQPQAVATTIRLVNDIEASRHERGASTDGLVVLEVAEIHNGQALAATPGLCQYWATHPYVLARLDGLVAAAMTGTAR